MFMVPMVGYVTTAFRTVCLLNNLEILRGSQLSKLIVQINIVDVLRYLYWKAKRLQVCKNMYIFLNIMP